jgi:glycosyltransferase involved in cell wall biosynthesis
MTRLDPARKNPAAGEHSLLVILPWSPDLAGGVSVVVRNLVRIWRKQDVPTTLLVSDWHSPKLSQDASAYRLRLSLGAYAPFAARVKAMLVAPRTLLRTWSLLRRRKITFTVFHYPSLEARGVALLKRLGLYKGQLVLAFHGSDVRTPEVGTEAGWDGLFAAADAVTACSRSLARRVEQCFALPADSVVPVYNGVDSTVFRPEARANRPPLALDRDCDDYIVSVGTFTAIKGHRYLVEAFANIAQDYPRLGLLIVGRDGEEREALAAQAQALGLAARVQLMVGLEQAEVAALVADAVLCVQPSLQEAFGMAVIEAGACGVCVAASSVGGHLELLEHERTGVLFEPADPASLATALTGILADPQRRARIARAFQQEVAERYSWTACAASYLLSTRQSV